MPHQAPWLWKNRGQAPPYELLINALSKTLDKQEAVAQSCSSLPDRRSNSHDKRDNFIIIVSLQARVLCDLNCDD